LKEPGHFQGLVLATKPCKPRENLAARLIANRERVQEPTDNSLNSCIELWHGLSFEPARESASRTGHRDFELSMVPCRTQCISLGRGESFASAVAGLIFLLPYSIIQHGG